MFPVRILALVSLLAIASAPGALRAEVAKEARDSFALALENLKAKKIDAAIEEFMKAYTADTGVLSLNDNGLLDTAISTLQQRVAANPQDLNLNFKLAELANIKGYTEESLKCYKRVLSLAPQSPQAAIAREEARKIESAMAASRAAAAQAAAAAAAASTAPVGVKPAAPSEDQASNKIQQLQEENQKLKQENDETKEKLDKLQKDYDELNVKAQKYYFYYTRFFADPRNVQGLQGGK